MTNNTLDAFSRHVLGEIKEQNLIANPRIDYYEFRNQWLAIFNAQTHNGKAPLGEWIQAKCRGNPFLGVDVYKDGNIIPDGLYDGQTTIEGGVYMFTVPPVLNNNIEVKLKSGKNISNVAVKSAEMSKRIAVAGDNHFKKNIIDDLVVEVEDENRLSKEMDKIFEHFGVKRKNGVSQVSTDTPNRTEENPLLRTSNDDLDFNF